MLVDRGSQNCYWLCQLSKTDTLYELLFSPVLPRVNYYPSLPPPSLRLSHFLFSPQGKLEEEMERAIERGELEEASEMSDRLAQREVSEQQAGAVFQG